MTDREAFISRWARRKREAAKGEDRPRERTDVSAAEAADAPHIEGRAENAIREDADASGATPGELTFDLSKLPSIESITAETDIRPFLARGVPSALRQAALRKMWVADPAIRDFIEIAENQWDFNAPGQIPGFDLSPPIGDVRRLVAEILGDRSGTDPEPHGAIAATTQTASPSVASDDSVPQATVSDQAFVQQAAIPDRISPDTASQNDSAVQHTATMVLKRRSHGGAMPT